MLERLSMTFPGVEQNGMRGDLASVPFDYFLFNKNWI